MPGEERVTRFSRSFRTIFDIGAVADLDDGQLLDRFVNRQGESAELAFAALLERHGPMVLRVCRQVLGEWRDPLDAFQATFLVLVRRARSVRKADSIASWLHGVAYRVAVAERAADARRQKHERVASVQSERPEVDDSEELGAILHGELDRLPDRFRAPLVLCHLEGMTHEQAAERLGWPVGTVKSRMARGRERLKARLIRRGLEPSSCWGVFAGMKLGAPPLRLLDATARTAVRLAAGQPIAGMVPASAIVLMQGVLKSMTLNKIRLAIACLLATGMIATVANVLAQKPEPLVLAPRIPAPPANPDEMGINYQIGLAEIKGIGWRSEFYKQLKPIARQGAYTVWAVDPATLQAIIDRGKSVNAPRVTAYKDAKMRITRLNDQNFVVGYKEKERESQVSTGSRTTDDAQSSLANEANQTTSTVEKIPELQKISEGFQLELTGHPVENGILVQGLIECTSFLGRVSHPIPELKPGSGLHAVRANVQVPWMSQAHYEGKWVVPKDGGLIIGLGIQKDDMADFVEQIVTIKASEISFVGIIDQPKKPPLTR